MTIINKTIRTLLLLLCLVSVPSCVKDVSFVVNSEPKVVVECVLDNTRQEQVMYLSYTKSKEDDSFPSLTDAVAVLNDLEDGLEVGRFSYIENHKWTLDFVPFAGHRYRLEVTVPGYDTIWAEGEVPAPYIKHHFLSNVEAAFDVTSSQMTSYGYVNIPQPENNPPDLQDRYKSVNGSCYSIEVPESDVMVSMVLLIKDGDDFLEAYSQVSDLAGVETTAGAVGLYGEDIVFESCISNEQKYDGAPYPNLFGLPLTSGPLRFHPDNVKDNYFMVSGTRESIVFSNLCCTYVDEDLEFYLNAVSAIASGKGSEDYVSVLLRENLPSNINGGIGYFGARYTDYLPWHNTMTPYRKQK